MDNTYDEYAARYGEAAADLLTQLGRQASQDKARKAEAQPWPQDVIAQFVNLVGATVDVRRTSDGRYQPSCTGCPRDDFPGGKLHACDWAQEHAERCRALPRPGV